MNRSSRRQRGFTLIEVVVSLTVFGTLLWILVLMTAEMRSYDKRMPINFMTHPQIAALIARMRRDVIDATYYPDEYTVDGTTMKQSGQLLLLYTQRTDGFSETVIYDFQTPGEVHRRAYSAGAMTSDWLARGIPAFRLDAVEINKTTYATRIQAFDPKGDLAIDQIFQPRTHH